MEIMFAMRSKYTLQHQVNLWNTGAIESDPGGCSGLPD